MALLIGLPLRIVAAQSDPLEPDLRALHLSLRDHAGALLQRYGVTFYALGGLILPDGSAEEFATDQWPDLQAPASVWQDSLVASFRRSGRPVRAVAMLLDIWPPDGTEPAPEATVARFHGETATACAEFEDPYAVQDDGSVRWGTPAVRPCTRLLLGPASH